MIYEQLGLFDHQERVEARISSIHDTLIAYGGKQRRFTKRSKVPSLVLWSTYELFKLGMTPEQISQRLKSKYPTDFEDTSLSKLLSLSMQTAQEVYLNSGHVRKYNLPNNELGQNKN